MHYQDIVLFTVATTYTCTRLVTSTHEGEIALNKLMTIKHKGNTKQLEVSEYLQLAYR